QSGQNEKSPFSGLCQLPPAADITIRWSSTRRAGSMVIALVEILRLIGPWPFPRHCCGSHNLCRITKGGQPSRHSKNNKNDTHVAISGTASESGKRYEPVAQVRRGGDCFRLHHGNHGIDVRGLKPERLVAVDLPLSALCRRARG